MKHLLHISLALLSTCTLLIACEDSEPSVSFGLETNEITIGAEGGMEKIRIESEGAWIANTESPWITVSPTNGHGTIDCQIKVDTTLLADDIRTGVVRFISNGTSESADLRIIQTGFEKMLTLSKREVTIPNYGQYGNRYFEIELTSNVDFDIDIPADTKWVNVSDYRFELDRGFRPRTVKLRFNWENNTRPWERDAVVKFCPKTSEELARLDELTILQEEAAKIEDNREGDSLAIIGCVRSLNLNMGDDEGELMNNWRFVTMWEPSDEGFTEDKRGRVRSVSFRQFYTLEGIPYEIQFLTKAETISFFGNGNAFLRSFSSGEYLAKLTQLKNLQLYSVGLSKLDDDFVNLKNLEVLDIGGNNFNEVPRILTPENFPNLKVLDMAACRRHVLFDMSTTTYAPDEWGGLRGEFPEWLLRWEKLEELKLSNNYIYGKVPDMKDYEVRYTEAEIMVNDTLPNGQNNPMKYNLIGKPKVLPNAKYFSINLNLLEGEIPEWILYHPHLMEWIPDLLVFNQDYVLNKDGKKPGFSNIPDKPDYYYEAYPLKKPEDYDE